MDLPGKGYRGTHRLKVSTYLPRIKRAVGPGLAYVVGSGRMSLPAKRSRIGRFVALPSLERRQLFEAWWRLLGAAMRLRFAPHRTVEYAVLAAAPPAGSAADREMVHAVARAVARAAAHHLQPMTCLPRALALQRMLARRGIAARLTIGVRKEGGGPGTVAAHAWVEVGGQAVGEPEAIAQHYLPFVLDRKK